MSASVATWDVPPGLRRWKGMWETDGPPPRRSLKAELIGQGRTQYCRMTRPDGAFTFKEVWEGQYTIRAQFRVARRRLLLHRSRGGGYRLFGPGCQPTQQQAYLGQFHPIIRRYILKRAAPHGRVQRIFGILHHRQAKLTHHPLFCRSETPGRVVPLLRVVNFTTALGGIPPKLWERAHRSGQKRRPEPPPRRLAATSAENPSPAQAWAC